MPSTPTSNRLSFNDSNVHAVYNNFMDLWEAQPDAMMEITPVVHRMVGCGYSPRQVIDYLNGLVQRGALLYKEGPTEIHPKMGEAHLMYYGPNGFAHGEQY